MFQNEIPSDNTQFFNRLSINPQKKDFEKNWSDYFNCHDAIAIPDVKGE